jgi:FkbM family methyltransferase
VAVTGTPYAKASVGAALTQLRRSVRNWYTVGLMAVIVAPNRIPPRKGLKGTWLGRYVATFRMNDGATIRCRLEDAGDVIDVYVNQEYDRREIPWSDLTSIIDIGSTTGCFTVWAARRSPRAKVTAVEPNPAVAPFLLENIKQNHLEDRVETIEAAIGAVPGLAAIQDERAFSNLVRVVPVEEGSGPTVRMMTLEQVFEQTTTNQCDLLKIDCEGGEYEVLLNAPESLLARIRNIVCEYHASTTYQPQQLVDRLVRSGFQVEAEDYTAFGLILATRPR